MLLASLLFLYFLLPSSAEAATIGRPANNLGLVGYWNFDMGKTDVDTVYDLSGSGNNGTLTNASGTANWVDGVIGGAMTFDGDDDSVNLTSSLGITNSDFTFSHWIKTVQSGSQVYTIGNAGAANGYRFGIQGGNIVFLIGTTTAATETTCGSTTINDGAWHLITGVFDRTDTTTFYCYVDGDLSGTKAIALYSGMSDTPGKFGKPNCCTPFDGSMDEVRIYNRVLSAGEVERLYKLGLSGGQKQNATPISIDNGLIGHWTFDGNQETAIVDSSPSANDGYLVNVTATSAALTPGKVGQALDFKEGDDYVNVGDQSEYDFGTGDFTIMTWLKTPEVTGEDWLVNKRASCGHENWWQFTIFNDTIQGVVDEDSGGTNFNVVAGSAKVDDDVWHHAAWTRSGAVLTLYVDGAIDGSPDTGPGTANLSSAYDLEFGDIPACAGNQYGGLLDDIRIYDRALSADEIQQIYNATGGTNYSTSAGGGSLENGLVGHWTFDGPDITATDILDVSVNSNHGDFIGGATTSAMTTGRIGQALEFDGSDDSVQIGSGIPSSLKMGTGSLTVSAWVIIDAFTGGGRIIAVGSNDRRYALREQLSGGDNIIAWVVDDTTTKTQILWANEGLGDGNWHHVIGVRDRDADLLRIYVDGVQRATGTDNTNNSLDEDTEAHIGRLGGAASTFFNGKIDDARIYNRALTQAEITRLYNMGK